MYFNLFFLLISLMFVEQAIGGRIDESNYPLGTIVIQPGHGTLTAAFAQLKGRSGRQHILLQPGEYHDNAVLKYSGGVVLQGAQGSASSYQANRVKVISSKKGLDDASALQVASDNVEVYSITFINNYGRGHDMQAVALTAAGNNQIYGQCSFQGYQDTLFDKIGKHFFDGCEIIGAMDFIFGSGTSFYSNPHIGILKSVTGGKQVITANRAGIFVFDNPNIQDVDGAAPESTYYGRAWGPNPKVVMQNPRRPASLNKDGWNMKAAGKIEFSSAGFLEHPKAETTNGHTSSHAYTKQEIFG